MFNKFNQSYNKRHLYNNVDEPPDKKLISDADLYIKQLSEKQRNTKTSLEEQLLSKQQFQQGNEFISLTQYTSGPSSLEEFTSIIQHADRTEKFKSMGLTDSQIKFVCDYNQGKEHFENTHKNMNKAVVEKILKEIHDIMKLSDNKQKPTKSNMKQNRLDNELVLSMKPTSIETKLLKFALDNQKSREKLPHPMDDITQIEEQLSHNLTSLDRKKIRRKARSLHKQIESINNLDVKEPTILPTKNYSLVENSKWDKKEPQSEDITRKKSDEGKVYTCKPQNYYTIKNGKIIKLNSAVEENKTKEMENKKLSLDQIKNLPKFENYEAGIPSKTLFLKNFPNNVSEADLNRRIVDFDNTKIVSIKIMKGKMRGQAFIELESVEAAEEFLNQYNGTFLKNRPIIIQFARAKASKDE